MSVFLGSAYAELNLNMTKFTEGLKTAKQDLNSFKSDMGTLASDFSSLGKSIEGSGKLLTKSVTLPILGVGAAAVKTTADFDASMSKVQALSGATGDEFDILRDKAIEMGGKTAFSATEAADAFSYMALAGWDTNQMLDGITGVLDLAASSQMDLAQASDLVTDYLTAFGLEAADAGRMANELAYAQANSNTTTAQLGEAFGNCAAQMHTAGQTMETTTAYLEAMANQGLKGSEAGTALAAVMRDITQKMEDGAIQIGNTSIQVQDQEGNFRDLIDIMADVEKATEGMGSAEKSAALMQTFTARSIKAVSMGLTESTDNMYEYRDALYDTDGAAGDMADTMLNNLNGQLTILKSTLETLLIQVGDILIPTISRFIERLRRLITWLSSLSQEEKEQVIRIAAIAAAIGPLLLTIAKFISTISTLKTGITGLITFIIAHPVLAGITAAVGLLTVGILKLKQQSDELYHSIADLTEEQQALKDAAQEYNDTIERQIENNKQLTDSIDLEYASQKSLLEELQSITDENGKVKEGYEDRARVIVDELASAFGIEISYQDGVIQKYDEVMNKIDEVIQKKKAEALLSANQQAYVEALEQQKEKYEGLKTAQEAYNEAVENEKTARENLTQAQKDYDEAVKMGVVNGMDPYTQALAKAGEEYEAYKDNLANATELLQEQEQAFYNNQAVINNYNDLQKAVAEGTADLDEEITKFTNNLVEDASLDYLKQQAADAEAYYQEILADFESGNVAISQDQVDAARKNYEEAKKILQEGILEYRAQGQNAANGYVEGFTEGASAVNSAVEQTMKDAQDVVARVNDSHSPSRKYKSLAKDAVDGYELGVEENFPNVLATLEENLQTLLDATEAINPDFNTAGVNLMLNLWEGMKSEWLLIQEWFTEIIKTVQDYAQQIQQTMATASSAAEGSHAGGLAYVPYNGYRAQLHEGERVLTRDEAKDYNSGNRGSGGYVFNYYSPKEIDPYQANKLFKQSVREREEGFI